VLQGNLFGNFQGASMRKTNDDPPMLSIYDLISAVTGTVNPWSAWADVLKRFQDNGEEIVFQRHQFPGHGQRYTPVTDARGVVLIINNMGGNRAAQFRTRCADIIVRYLGGDESLVSEIRRIREAQETMPDSHPLRAFGQDVEARRAERSPEDEERAAKRRKLEDELEIERLEREIEKEREKGEVEIREIQLDGRRRITEASERLLESLTKLAPTPALTGMINGARHNLAVKSVAHVKMLTDAPEDAPVESPAASALYGRRVTILEYGRDVLGLRGELLSSQKLSVVGRTVGTRWMQTPGKGSLNEVAGENGEKRWERTFIAGGSRRLDIINGQLTSELLANNRIRFSDAYLGMNEVGAGMTFNTWTYPDKEAGEIIKEAFAA
jgi:hypothetical protein